MRLQRIISVLLVALILFQCVGFAWLHSTRIGLWKARQMKEIRLQAESGMPIEGTIAISVSDPNSLAWEDENEFEYQGRMYDVLSKHRDNAGNWIYRCLPDHHESNMKATLAKLLAGQNDQDGFPAFQLRIFLAQYVAECPQVQGLADEREEGFRPDDWDIKLINLPGPDSPPPIQG